MQKTKMCSACKRELPANTDYYHKHSEKQYGLDNRCKECKGYKFTKKLLSKEGFKICKECDIEKPLSEFSKVGDSYGNLRATCKSCEYEKRSISIYAYTVQKNLKLIEHNNFVLLHAKEIYQRKRIKKR